MRRHHMASANAPFREQRAGLHAEGVGKLGLVDHFVVLVGRRDAQEHRVELAEGRHVDYMEDNDEHI